MSTGIPVDEHDIITADKMNLKLEDVAENPQNLVASRAFTTTYQNTDPKRTLHLNINFIISLVGGGTGGGALYQGSSSSPSTLQSVFGYSNSNPGNKTILGPIIALIPPLYYYKTIDLATGGGTTTISKWWETLL